jgi:endonuclease-3
VADPETRGGHPGTRSSIRRAIPWNEIIGALETFVRDTGLSAVSEVARRRHDPFEVLISTMISLRTKDEVTAAASRRLLARAATPSLLAALPEQEIARLIYPAGFYNSKAKNLKAAAAILATRHDSRVPATMEELLALPGVGRKTANLVRNLGYGLEGICVDTHVHRICNRLGWVQTSTPEQTEAELEKILPRRYWIGINEILVRFGQRLCTPISPKCSLCPIAGHCPRLGVIRSR